MSVKLSVSNEAPEDFDSRTFRNAMGQFATGVVVITTEVDGEAHAMTANAFMSGSLEPPLVLVSVACTARMHEKIPAAGGFGISILCNEQVDTSQHFAGKPTPAHQPQFEQMGELPVVAGANVQLVTRLVEAYPCGDHTLFVGEVQKLKVAEQPVKPLLFHGGRYSELAQAC
ncbi:flavin reductase family protein [Pseudomonas schmalbachii]|uniref:Flavin reductase family protein n=1 Tax=Pseudomonas schmalbachii TaxID=2816993 RepID=A0ABS3TUY2_9PSED|nr:flavin reductase family protein [Pseudomonas schmalbachii]MBO3276943.1 flavin reductase family protein [Pseudomonas schmalbachii]